MTTENLTTADRIELETATKDRKRGSSGEFSPEPDRWTKYGHDRLYFNGLWNDTYLDLETGRMHFDGAAPIGRVSVDGDTLTIDIENKSDEYHIELTLVGGAFEAEAEAEIDDEDHEDDSPTDADDAPTAIADGGTEEIRSRRDVERTDAHVRTYSADGHLYAYRDGDEHVVVSRGDEPATRWTDRVPAERKRVVPGQQLWTIPDNWQFKVKSTRDDIAYGIFLVPETNVWIKLSIPTNNHLVDAWYGVKAVGELTVDPAGDLGNAREVRQLAADLAESGRLTEADADALREAARNWDAVATDLEHATEWVRDEGLWQEQPGDQPISVSDGWEWEYQRERVFRPGETLEREADLLDYEVPTGVLLDELRNADLLPSYYRFELGIDESAVGMEYYTRALEEAGCTSPEVLDYYWVELEGLSQSQRAEDRGVSQPTVSDRVNDAKGKLNR